MNIILEIKSSRFINRLVSCVVSCVASCLASSLANLSSSRFSLSACFAVLSFLVSFSADSQTSAEVLFQTLSEKSEEGILFGHHDDPLYGFSWTKEGVSDTYAVCGKYPAVVGFDMSGIEKGRSSYPSMSFGRVREEILKQHENGGYTVLSWHATNPVTGGNAWDVSDTNAVHAVLNEKVAHAAMCQQLDSLAKFLLSLRSADGSLVPVIFRPFHECHGAWFWWGSKCSSASDYVSLWHFTVNYLKSAGVTNVVYVFSPASDFGSEANYLQRYPGDEFVDILGFEGYRRTAASVAESRREFIQRMNRNLAIVETLASKKRKLVALTETGGRNNDDAKWWTKAVIAGLKGHRVTYLEVWRNATNNLKECYGVYPGCLSEKDFRKFSKNSAVLFR